MATLSTPAPRVLGDPVRLTLRGRLLVALMLVLALLIVGPLGLLVLNSRAALGALQRQTGLTAISPLDAESYQRYFADAAAAPAHQRFEARYRTELGRRRYDVTVMALPGLRRYVISEQGTSPAVLLEDSFAPRVPQGSETARVCGPLAREALLTLARLAAPALADCQTGLPLAGGAGPLPHGRGLVGALQLTSVYTLARLTYQPAMLAALAGAPLRSLAAYRLYTGPSNRPIGDVHCAVAVLPFGPLRGSVICVTSSGVLAELRSFGSPGATRLVAPVRALPA